MEITSRTLVPESEGFPVASLTAPMLARDAVPLRTVVPALPTASVAVALGSLDLGLLELRTARTLAHLGFGWLGLAFCHWAWDNVGLRVLVLGFGCSMFSMCFE